MKILQLTIYGSIFFQLVLTKSRKVITTVYAGFVMKLLVGRSLASVLKYLAGCIFCLGLLTCNPVEHSRERLSEQRYDVYIDPGSCSVDTLDALLERLERTRDFETRQRINRTVSNVLSCLLTYTFDEVKYYVLQLERAGAYIKVLSLVVRMRGLTEDPVVVDWIERKIWQIHEYMARQLLEEAEIKMARGHCEDAIELLRLLISTFSDTQAATSGGILLDRLEHRCMD